MLFIYTPKVAKLDAMVETSPNDSHDNGILPER